MKSPFSGNVITQKIKLYFNNMLQLCPAWPLRCYLPISVTSWGLNALLPSNKCSEAERISTKNYTEKQLKNKLVSALISLPLFPFLSFFLLLGFLHPSQFTASCPTSQPKPYWKISFTKLRYRNPFQHTLLPSITSYLLRWKFPLGLSSGCHSVVFVFFSVHTWSWQLNSLFIQ